MSSKGALIAGAAAALGCGAASATVPAASPRARLRDFVCQRALDPPARAISITAVMRPLPGTRKMEMRFELLRRLSHRRAFARVRGGDLGRWISPPDATLGQLPEDVWNLDKQVVNLVAPASYRFRVTFRWIGVHGRALGRAGRLSPTCDQPELRPDLQVRSIAVRQIAGKPSEDAYLAEIRNAGATGAGPFEVELIDAGSASIRTVAWLGPHSARLERLVGAACAPADPPTVIVDPRHRVEDYNRADNSLTARCPAPVGP
jgi:hypothetical protein